MANPIYEVAAGETLILYLEAVIGDPSTATAIDAHIKPIFSPTAPVPDATVASVGALIIAYQAVSPGLDSSGAAILPGWYLTLPASLSATLAPGYYITDMAFSVGGAPFGTSPAVINVVNAVSLP